MPTVTSLLKDFRDYAQGRLEGFTGREWLVEKVRAWLGRADAPPFLLILGEPGIGKSAFAAHLWRDHGLPHAVHFCIAERSGTTEPLSFVESLNQQLKDNLPGFAEAFRQVQEERYADARRPIHAEAHVQTGDVAPGGAVIGVKIIQQIRDLPPERALDFALRRPLQRMAENGTLPQAVLLVDALDEARTYFDHPNILDLLARADDFPTPVRFILLSRPEPDILGVFREVPVEVIHAESEENRRDVTAYLHRAWEENPALRQAVQAWGAEWDAAAFAARLGERSEWNFLYLRGVLPLIVRGEVQDPHKLPAGLDDFYAYLLRTRIGEKEWREWGADLLETMLAVQEPATLEHLARLLGWEVRPTHQRLLRISELLDPVTLQQGRYWRYHWSLTEFVADRQRAGLWWCNLPAAHRRIAYHYLNEWDGLEQGLPGLRRRGTRRADEGYGLRHLGAHLLASGETETLRRLLTLEHEGRNLWFTVQEEEGQAAVFLEDVRRLWGWARAEDARAAAQGNEAPHLGTEIRCALIEASIHSLSGRITLALLVALVEKGIWPPSQGLVYAHQVPDLKQRVEALGRLVPYLPPEQQPQILAEALATARKIKGERARAEALATLIPHLPPEQKPQVLSEAIVAARKIVKEGERNDALTALATRLAELGYWQESLIVASEIEHSSMGFVVKVMVRLVSQLAELGYHREALAAAREIGDKSARAQALAALTSHLPPDLLVEALAAAREIGDKSARAQALAALVTRLARLGRHREALDVTKEIDDEFVRVRTLTSLAPYLPEDLRKQALHKALVAAGKIRYEKGCAKDYALALAALAPYLPPDLREKALRKGLAAAKKIWWAEDRAEAVIALAPHLPPDLLPQVLAAAREIEGKDDRALALAALALTPHLPHGLQKLQKQALREALATEMSWRNRASALAILATHLAKQGYYQEALVTARKIGYKGICVDNFLWTISVITDITKKRRLITRVLLTAFFILPLPLTFFKLCVTDAIAIRHIRNGAMVSLASHLTKVGYYREALAAAREILWADDRAEALTALIPHLSPEQQSQVLAEALAAAREIKHGFRRAEALTALIPHLLPKQQPQVLAEALAAAREIKHGFGRAEALTALVPHLPPEQQPQVLAEALAAARKIRDGDACTEALNNLASYSPKRLLHTVSDIGLALLSLLGLLFIFLLFLIYSIFLMVREGIRVEVPVGLARCLTKLGYHQKALAVVKKIVDEDIRAKVLVTLAPHLLPELLLQVLAVVRGIRDADTRADVLAALPPRLAKLGYYREALTTAMGIQDADARAKALAALVPHMPPHLLPQAMAVARKVERGDERDLTLAALAHHLAEMGYPEEALTAAREIRWADARAKALAALIPHLPPQVLAEALAAAREILWADDRAEVLTALIPHLSPEQQPQVLAEALAAAREIKHGFRRAEALTALIPHLLPDLLPQALATAREIGNESARVEALAALAPHLPLAQQPQVLAEALAAARDIGGEDDRAKALAALAPHLPLAQQPQVLAEALAAARDIGGEDDRAKALAALAPRLPPDLLGQALAVAREIESIDARTLALVGPSPRPLKDWVLDKCEWEETRSKARSALVRRLAALPRSTLYPTWDEMLPVLAARTRRDLLTDLRVLKLVIRALGGAKAIAETARAIQDVARWWP
jgi:uncharacterized protein YeeX (DUF496 family)